MQRNLQINDYGSEAIEMVIIVPVFLLVLTVVIQFVLWALAAHAVELAAIEGEHAAVDYGSTPAAGKVEAANILHDIAGSLVLDPQVRLLPGQDGQLSVIVSGHAIALLPDLNLQVQSTSIGPLQRFRRSE